MKKSLLILFALFLISVKLIAQGEKVIHGLVTDSLNVPLKGVSIKVIGTKKGVYSDSIGQFSIAIPSTVHQLEFSSIGFQTKRITIEAIKLHIILKPYPSNLTDVVVIGTQTISKRKLTAAVSSISGDVIQNLPAESVDQLLQGRIAGLNVQVTSGEPGVAPTVVVRGNSTVNTGLGNNAAVSQAQALSGPLYVIDGIPLDPSQITNNYDVTGTNYLAGININDIASVDVEKDAAATAAWGSRGANGVVYIKTRVGKSKTPSFELNSYVGSEKKPKLVPTYTGEAERTEKLSIIQSYYPYTGNLPLPIVLTDSLNPSYNNATDWQGLFYKSGSIQNVDMTMSQATETVNYRVSGNYYNAPGIIKQFGYTRYSIRGNFNFNISKKLNSQFIFSVSKGDRQRGAKFNNSDANTPFGGGAQPTSFYRLAAYDSSEYLGIASQLRNKNTDMNYTASWVTNYKIFPWLEYTLMGAATMTNSDRDYFSPSNSSSTISELEGYSGGVIPSYAEADRNTYTTYYARNSLNAHKVFNAASGHAHTFALVLNQEYNGTQNNYSTLSGYNTPSNSIQVVSGIPQSDLTASSDFQKDALLSFAGQLTYDYDGKYLLYGSLRTDGSSRFGSNNKWGAFEAGGIGWIVSEEKFMSSVKSIFTYLKIRASYGVSGIQAPNYNAPFNDYQLLGTYNGTQAVLPSFTNGLTLNNLGWGKMTQSDLGIEMQLLNNRIAMTADIYNKLTTNDFWNFNLPYYTGFGQVTYNAKDLWINNKGLDLNITTHNLSPKSKFQWNTNLVFSYNKNIIAKLPNHNQSIVESDYYGVNRLYAVGQPVYEMYQLKYLGVYNHASQIPFNPITGADNTYFHGSHTIVPGDPIFQNISNGTDVWDGEPNGNEHGSLQPTGNPNPKFTGGFNNDFSYKSFYLSIVCIYSLKREVINTYEQQQYYNLLENGIYGFATATLPADLVKGNYWTPTKALNPNYKASIPSINPYAGYYYQYNPLTSMFNVDGSYFKVKYVTLSYNLPKTISDKMKLKTIRIYGTISNLLIIKNKQNTMPDPEAVDQTGIYTGGLYPQAKDYTLGLTVQF